VIIKTKIISINDELKCARTLEVSVKSKVTITPRRVLSASRSKYNDETMLWNRSIRGFVEIYRRISHEILFKVMSEEPYIQRFNYEVSSMLKRAENDIIIGIVEYNSEGKMPGKGEIECLFHLFNNPLLDIIVPPIVPKLPCEDYIKFLDEFIDIFQTCSFHAILAPVIPHYSVIDVSRLFEYYAKKDEVSKNFVCADFNGGNAISQYTFVSKIVRESQKFEREFGEPCLRYAINLKYGKATKKQYVVPAKDIIIFAMGFDLFGANHKLIPRLDYVGDYDLATKIFNRVDYGYYSLEMAGNAVSDIGDYEVKLADVLEKKISAKVFNAERHGLESLEISKSINEQRLSKYIKSKSKVTEDEKTLRKIFKVNEEAYKGNLLKYIH
jgi:hypothetical protein